MTLDDYAREKARNIWYKTCTHTDDDGICVDCLQKAIVEACTDQKRGAVQALRDAEENADGVYGQISKERAIAAVEESSPISSTAEGEESK